MYVEYLTYSRVYMTCLFFGKSAFELFLLFLEDEGLFANLAFSVVFTQTSTTNLCVSTTLDHFRILAKQVEDIIHHRSNLGF